MINVATSVLTSKVRALIFFSVSIFQTMRREVRTISLCRNVCCKRRGTGCESKTTQANFFLFVVFFFFITCFSLLLFEQIVLQDEISPETVEEESKTTKSKGKL